MRLVPKGDSQANKPGSQRYDKGLREPRFRKDEEERARREDQGKEVIRQFF
jgi:hypothetical protein